MLRFAVVGHPVAHSQSPQIHEQFAQQFDLDLSYERLLAPLDAFADCVEAFFAGGGSGLNVTVPFKGQAAQWVTELDLSARRAGAVNTIVSQSHGYRGYNTDGAGLVADLKQSFQLDLRGLRIAVLGAGGAAAGALGPLLAETPARLVLANRTLPKAQTLAAQFDGVEAVPYENLSGSFDLVINATSVGLAATDQGFAAIIEPAQLKGTRCYDMLYGPSAGFGDYAVAAGAVETADGLGMLVEQAAAAFTLWLGLVPETGPVIAALRLVQEAVDDR
ncbi:MAG: shikimate dehydrogenase [Pseudomonadales bacterium]